MPVSAKWLPKVFECLFNKEIDLNSDTLKVALFTQSLSVTRDSDKYFDAAPFTSNQLSGGGYAVQTLSTPTINYDSANDRVYLDGGDTTFSTLTTATSGEPRYAVIYDDTPSSNKPVIVVVDFGQNEVRDAADLKLQWHADGIAGVTVS